tara:strand:- start:245 stop:502 length:258 start_codon:yes stop_codon:yes gene_type:complete
MERRRRWPGDAGQTAKLKEIWNYDTPSKVTDAGIAHLAGFRKIEILGISGTQMPDKGPEKLKGLADLKRFSFARNKVTDAGLAHH